MRILVAEGETITRAILQRAVEKLGYECFVAADGLETWKLFQNTEVVDAIISDWIIPGVEGLEYCRRLREEKREGYTYFIFLTALGGKAQLLEGMRAGADDYLIKPLDQDELQVRLIAVSRVIRNPLEGFRVREAQPPRTTLSSRPRQQPLRKIRKGTPGFGITSPYRKLKEHSSHLWRGSEPQADFTTMGAHEIGSPLATICGFLEVLATGELDYAFLLVNRVLGAGPEAVSSSSGLTFSQHSSRGSRCCRPAKSGRMLHP